MLTSPRYSFRRLGCGACGCLTLVILLIVLACVGLFALVRSAQAATPRHVVLLIDQSNSVMNRSAVRSLVRETALATLDRLQQPDRSTHDLEVRFFGTQATTLVSGETGVTSQRLAAALAQSTALGGTAFLSVLADLFDLPPTGADVVLVTDGAPDPVEDTSAYRAQMHALAQQLSQRDIVVSAFLIGSLDQDEWLTMWQDFASITGGVVREIHASAEIASAVNDLPLRKDAATPMPTLTLTPTTIPSPTNTAVPTVTATSLPIIRPTVAQSQPASVSPWSWVLLALVTVGVIGGLSALAFMARKPAPPAPPPLHDEGTLEIFDPDRETAQRADLHTMGLGEVWGIGGDVQCRIHVEGAEPIELAALIMTPDGPMLETRGQPLSWEGRPVQAHLLFDGDELYLGRLILIYQNFFRQRKPSEEEDKMMAR